MSHIEIIILAFSLALDASTVALALSSAGHLGRKRAKFRISFHFGLFQFIMPIAGWGIGTQLEPLIASFGHWIAAGLLSFVAARKIRSATHSPEDQGGARSESWMVSHHAFDRHEHRCTHRRPRTCCTPNLRLVSRRHHRPCHNGTLRSWDAGW